MRKTTVAVCAIILMVFSFVSCSKKGDAVVEPFIAKYKFTAYTIDSFRFKITVNDVVISDSLKTGSDVTKDLIFTTDKMAKLKVFNANTNQLYTDTTIALKLGSYIISIVQLSSGQNPAIPQAPAEAAPLPGNSKIRFQYVKPQPIPALAANGYLPFFDSIKCVVKKSFNGSGLTTDTVILSQYETTEFYENKVGTRYNIEIRNPVTNFVYDNGNGVSINTGGAAQLPDFNTAIIYSYDTLSSGRFRYKTTRIY